MKKNEPFRITRAYTKGKETERLIKKNQDQDNQWRVKGRATRDT